MLLRIFLIALFFVQLVSTVYAQEQIPNGSFEYWQGDSPDNWNTTNIFSEILGVYVVSEDQNSIDGDYSIKLQTYQPPIGPMIPGLITFGQVYQGYVGGGLPFHSRPFRLTGYYSHPTPNDNISIIAVFTRYKGGNRDTLGRAGFMTSDTNSTYSQFSEEINWFSQDQPDTMNIVAFTDLNKAGSILYLDALHFDYSSAVQDNTPEIQEFLIHNNMLKISPEISVQAIKIYDLFGNKVMDIEKINPDKYFDLSFLSKGCYFLIAESKNKTIFHKFMIY